MPFTPPVFNLNANVWKNGYNAAVFGPIPPAGAPDFVTPAQLYLVSRLSDNRNAQSNTNPNLTGHNAMPMEARFPAGTDILAAFWTQPNWSVTDLIELPSGSKRWYIVINVDDCHKGFSNEYRIARVVMIAYTGLRPMA